MDISILTMCSACTQTMHKSTDSLQNTFHLYVTRKIQICDMQKQPMQQKKNLRITSVTTGHSAFRPDFDESSPCKVQAAQACPFSLFLLSWPWWCNKWSSRPQACCAIRGSEEHDRNKAVDGKVASGDWLSVLGGEAQRRSSFVYKHMCICERGRQTEDEQKAEKEESKSSVAARQN